MKTRTALSAAAAGALLLAGEVKGSTSSDASADLVDCGTSMPSEFLTNRSLRSAPSDGVISVPLSSHHGLQQRRRRERRYLEDDNSSAQPDQQLAALYQGYGTHYVDLWVGTPPQRQTVIVDTGSGQTAFPCSGCKDCGESYHTDSYFIEDDSTTFQELSCDECVHGRCGDGPTRAGSSNSERICRLSMSYSEGSKWSAYEATDLAYAGGPHDEPLSNDDAHMAGQFPLTFGCQTLITGLFKTQLADGIMGMINKRSSYWSQVYQSGTMAQKSFSLCFTRQATACRDGTEAGALTLGGVDERFHSSPMVYTMNTRPTSGSFSVNLKNVYLREGGGESAEFKGTDGPVLSIDIDPSVYSSGHHGHIVDSGTTMTYIDKTIGAALKAKWEKIAGRKYTNDPISLTDEELLSLPTLLFQFEASQDAANAEQRWHGGEVTGLAGGIDESNPTDVIVAMPASHYMYYSDEDDKYQSGLYLDKRSGSTLGANFMMGHNVMFDVENGRVGWAESDCDYFDVTGIKPPGSDEREGPEKGDDEEIADDDAGIANVKEDIPSRPPGIGPSAGATDDVVCPTTGCKMGVLAVVSVLVTLFIVYRRRYGRRDRPDRRGIEAVPTTEDDLELYEEEDRRRDGYADEVGDPPEMKSFEAEKDVVSGKELDEDEGSEFSI